MAYPDTSGLPVTIDADYADDPDRPGVKAHQQAHDIVHAAVKEAPAAFVAGNDARLSDARTPTDGSVTTAKIADGAVTAAKVAADVATQAELDALIRNPVASSLGVGTAAQQSLTTGTNNTGVGTEAQKSMTTGSNNTGVGYRAQRLVTTGFSNTGVGNNTQQVLSSGNSNTGIGDGAQYLLTTGNSNTGIGALAQLAPAGLSANGTTTGLRQTMIGAETGQSSATQINDAVGVGYRAVCGANKAMALGALARSDHAGSVALGSDTLTTLAGQVMVGPRDVEITDATKGIVLLSPDGSRYRVTVSNTGTLTAAAA